MNEWQQNKSYDLKNALFQARRILEMRSGTANSDVNVLTIPQAVPWWVLSDLVSAATSWQPIETAPKDGSRCDVWAVYYDAYQSRGERHVDAQYREQHAAWFDLYGNKLDWSELDETDDMKPRGRKTTHWMPLPAPPKAIG